MPSLVIATRRADADTITSSTPTDMITNLEAAQRRQLNLLDKLHLLELPMPAGL